MSKKCHLPISVVIASVGDISLFKTIDSIFSGRFVPSQVLISLPPDVKINIDAKKLTSITIINSPKKGQVSQRCFGFKHINQEYVVQCDDDIIFEEKTFISLYKNIMELGRGNIVGPIYLNLKNNRNITKLEDGLKGFIISLYHKYICLAPWSCKRMGFLTKIGIGYGVDEKKLKSKRPFNVTWLNGGCVMCHKDDLILENYFPFDGKAYFEDTIHSILWNKNKKKMWVLPNAKCFQNEDNYLLDEFQSYQNRFQIHKFVVNMLGGSLFRLYIWRILFLTKLLILKALLNVKK